MNPTTDFTIRSFLGGYDNNFTYLVTCGQTESQFIVDASIPIKTLEKHILNEPKALLITHSHGDHIAFIDTYLKKFSEMKVVCFPESTNLYNAKQLIPIANNEIMKVGRLLIQGIHTPGHYFDSVCYLMSKTLFTGDTLFVGRTGRVKRNKSSIKELYNSVYKKLLTLPGDTLIYPGHDYGKKPTISLEENKQISPLLRATCYTDFIQRMEDYENSRLKGS